MPRPYTVSKRVHCKIKQEACMMGDDGCSNNGIFRMDESPPCERCDHYLEWKRAKGKIRNE